MGRLDNKVCIVTGSNSGVGAATAELFASEGAKVVITARRQELLDAEAEKIKAAGGTVLAVRCDVSKEEDCIELVRKTVEAFGTVDVLVNNAGVLDGYRVTIFNPPLNPDSVGTIVGITLHYRTHHQMA